MKEVNLVDTDMVNYLNKEVRKMLTHRSTYFGGTWCRWILRKLELWEEEKNDN